MENDNYNSLTQKLIQNGILPSDDSENFSGNIFETHFNLEKKEEEFAENPIENEAQEHLPKKRINKYDLDMIKYDGVDEAIHETINFKVAASLKVLSRFLNFKKNNPNNPELAGFDVFFQKMFPKLYNAKLTKDAVSKLLELDIDTKVLLDKTIPYGENESRYEDLIKYLSYANQIQKNLKRKTD